MGKTDEEVLQLLSSSEPLTLAEIAGKLSKKPKAVFSALRKLFEEGKIVCDPRTRRYVITREQGAKGKRNGFEPARTPTGKDLSF